MRPSLESLESLAAQWPTPMASERDLTPKKFMRGNANLAGVATLWQTPRASDGDKGGPNQALKGKPALTAQAVKNWPTPRAMESGDYQRDPKGNVAPTLTGAAKSWPTPAARDAKGANGPEHLARPRGHHDQLPNAVALFDGPPVQEMQPAGEPSSKRAPTSRRLNPAFVEWLMGWPPGWSLPVGG